MSCRGPGHTGQQVVHFTAGTPFREGFEEGAARIHHRNDRRCERLAEDERRGHGERGDDIEAHLAAPNAPDDFDHKRCERGNNSCNPDQVRDLWLARKVECESHDQPGCGHQQECGLEAIGTGLFHAAHLPPAEAIAAGY